MPTISIGVYVDHRMYDTYLLKKAEYNDRIRKAFKLMLEKDAPEIEEESMENVPIA